MKKRKKKRKKKENPVILNKVTYALQICVCLMIYLM